MPLTYDDYTIGWIAALPHELAPARALLDEKHDNLEGLQGDNNTYTLGRMGKHNIVIAALPMGVMGTNAAANAIKDLVRSFKNVRFGLMVGIGGGVPTGPEDVRLGDIVVSTRQGRSGGVIQYDFGTKTQHGINEDPQRGDFMIKGFLRDPPTALQTAVTNLKSNSLVDGYEFHNIYEKMLTDKPRMKQTFKRPTDDTLYKAGYMHQAGEDCSTCDASQVVKRRSRDESFVHYGVIGSGNQVMRDAICRDKLYRQERILCFEMEAAGLMTDFECMVIRGICDYCDSHKNKDWQFYAAAVAAAYAKELLLILPVRQVDDMPRSKVLDTIHKDLKEIVTQNAEILSAQQSLELREVLAWIAAPDPETNFRLAQQRKDPETGTWIADSEVYIQWKTGFTRHLWLYGKAGCGKSVLTTTAIPDIQQYCADNNAEFAMFYFSFSDTGKQSWLDCLKSLVVQLARKPAWSMLIQACKESKGSPRQELLRKVLLTAIEAYEQVFIALDALDESPTEIDGDETVRSILLANLTSLSADAPNVKLFLTSRDLVDIRNSMETLGASPIPMIAETVNRDIKKYVTRQLSKDKKLSKLNDKTKIDIEATLMEKADGMFRWAYCQLQQLRSLPFLRPKDVERALKTLPETLDETYERILKEIDKNLQEEVLTLLRWLAYSQRPLSLSEITETITIDLGQEGGIVDADNRPEPEDVVKLLSALVIVKHKIDEEATDDNEELADDSGSNANTQLVLQDMYIQLAHFSVKEYLQSPRSVSLRFHLVVDQDQHFLSNCCLVYLMRYAESEKRTGSKRDFVTFPLLFYAAHSWSEHYTDTGNIQYTLSFLQSRMAIESWHKIESMGHIMKLLKLPSANSTCTIGLYLASFFGLNTVAQAMIELGADINAKCGAFGTALEAAVRYGHEKIVKMLIAAGADVSGGEKGDGPLYIACQSGNVQIIRRLIEAGAGSSVKQKDHHKAIEIAAKWGQEAIVDLLIDAAADFNVRHGDLIRPLIGAAGGGQEHLVKRFIKHYGTDTALGVKDLRMPLLAAVENGKVHIIRLLIEAGADINAQDEAYCTALQAAIYRLHNEGILLEVGADINKSGILSALQAAIAT